jgi:hypothetical protein
MRVRGRWFAQHVFIVWMALLVLTSCNIQIGQTPKREPSSRVLFVGNSYTAVNGGIDKQHEGLDPSIETLRIDVAGATLENHWMDGNALQTIHRGGWAYVILQEQSQTPILNQKKFFDYASYFDAEITSSGAKTILLMTWERPDSARSGVTAANLANAYTTLGKALTARVAPAGSAFVRSLREKPSLVLYSQDGHPTMYGTYLAACVLYATVFGTSPVGNPYSDASITPELRMYFERIAAETMGF